MYFSFENCSSVKIQTSVLGWRSIIDLILIWQMNSNSRVGFLWKQRKMFKIKGLTWRALPWELIYSKWGYKSQIRIRCIEGYCNVCKYYGMFSVYCAVYVQALFFLCSIVNPSSFWIPNSARSRNPIIPNPFLRICWENPWKLQGKYFLLKFSVKLHIKYRFYLLCYENLIVLLK
jgi:hypothetical protein